MSKALTTGEILDEIADGLMVYGACNEEEGRCWEHSTLCRICFLTGWQSMFQSATRSDYEESSFKTIPRIERLLRSFANQQIIRSNVQPNLDRQQFVDHYKQELMEAYELKMRNDFKCELADKPISHNW